MLEACFNQAAGLQGLASPMRPRLMAVASHGNQQGELPLLWSLCATWVDMGLPVMVLDGHARESDQNPGLQQLLDDSMNPTDDLEHLAWSVLPAATGFEQLTGISFNSDSVGDLFQKFAAVVLYAPATRLSLLLCGSGVKPLLVLTPLKTSSLTAYQTMKQLLLEAHLQPTIASIALENAPTGEHTGSAQNLQDCAQSFLGLTVKPITISTTATGYACPDEINRLALHLLESAVFLGCQPLPRTH